MADEMLPPIVTELLLNNDEFLAKLQESRDAMAAATEEMDKSSSVIQSGAGAAGAGGAEGAAKDEEVKAEETGASSDLASMEEGALAGAAAQGELGKAAEDTEEKVTSSSSKMADSSSKGSKLLEKASKGAALGILAVGAASVDVAIKLEQNEATLATALKNTNEGTLAQHRAAIEKTENAMVKYGKTPGETVRALAVLTTASKSLSTATNDVGIAADYAARKHTSLEAAAQMLAKVYSGTPGRAIKELGINLPAGSGKLATLESGKIAVEKAKKALEAAEAGEGETTAKEGKKKDSAIKGVTTAQNALKLVEEEVASGKIKSAEADTKLEAAHLKVAAAAEKVQEAEEGSSKASLAVEKARETLAVAEEKQQKNKEAIPKVFQAISTAVEGEAAKQSKTLGGQAAVLKAEADQIAGVWGKDLIPYLKDAAVDIGAFIGWLQKGSIPAKALEVAFVSISTALAADYAIKKVWNLGKDIADMGKWVAARLGMGAAADTSAGMVTGADGEIVYANEVAGTSFMEMVAPIAAVAAAIAGVVAVAEGMSRILGKGSFIENVKELLSGNEGLHKAEASREKNEKGELSAIEKLTASLAKKHETHSTALRNAINGYNETTKHTMEELEGAGDSTSTLEKYRASRFKGIEKLQLKKLADGALITGPTIAELGEKGPEAVIPLNGINASGSNVQALSGAGSSAGGGLHVNNLTVNGAQKPNAQIVTELYRALRPMLQGA